MPLQACTCNLNNVCICLRETGDINKQLFWLKKKYAHFFYITQSFSSCSHLPFTFPASSIQSEFPWYISQPIRMQ